MVGKSWQMSGRGIISIVIPENKLMLDSVVVPILEHLLRGPSEDELFEVEL